MGVGHLAITQSRALSAQKLVRRWQRDYQRRLFVTDLIVISVAVFGSQVFRFGLNDADQGIPLFSESGTDVDYTMISAAIVVSWMIALSTQGTRDRRTIGSGATEYRRVADATLRIFGLLAILAFAFQWQLARGYLLIALPLGLLLLVFSRWTWHRWLLRRRQAGQYLHRAILFGDRVASEHVAAQMQRDPGVGFELVGAVTEKGNPRPLLDGTAVVGDFSRLMVAVDELGADTVVVTGADSLGPRGLREVGWRLGERAVSLIVAPALTDVAGPRIHARPVAGLPLIQVDYPVMVGGRYIGKRLFDLAVSVFLLAVLSPIFLTILIAVRRDSPGPAIFVQERVGLNGRLFGMLKFRSMSVDAEERLPTLLDQSEGNGVLFKLRSDPRVTKVGALLRKHSLDELPQLWNVLRGDMSLVGPRPPLAREVAAYDEWARRRMLVKPGMTGLWQTQGRSSLSWEDSVRLDLYYVENWSLTGDLVILYRTVRAVATAEGAY